MRTPSEDKQVRSESNAYELCDVGYAERGSYEFEVITNVNSRMPVNKINSQWKGKKSGIMGK